MGNVSNVILWKPLEHDIVIGIKNTTDYIGNLPLSTLVGKYTYSYDFGQSVGKYTYSYDFGQSVGTNKYVCRILDVIEANFDGITEYAISLECWWTNTPANPIILVAGSMITLVELIYKDK